MGGTRRGKRHPLLFRLSCLLTGFAGDKLCRFPELHRSNTAQPSSSQQPSYGNHQLTRGKDRLLWGFPPSCRGGSGAGRKVQRGVLGGRREPHT